MHSAGTRPLPSCLGGGDLDGDEYNLIPLNDLPGFRPTRQETPAEYDKAPRKILKRHSTMDDVASFVIEYINSDVSPALICEPSSG
jgi:RNA dependent RNA polymerase.